MNNTNTDQIANQYMSFEDYQGQSMQKLGFDRRYETLSAEFRLVEELIRLRIEQNLTQAELAAKVGIKQAALARLESGRSNPTFMTLARIAEALDKKIIFA